MVNVLPNRMVGMCGHALVESAGPHSQHGFHRLIGRQPQLRSPHQRSGRKGIHPPLSYHLLDCTQRVVRLLFLHTKM